MWWSAALYYVARIGEARPTLIVVAAMVAIEFWCGRSRGTGRCGLPESLLARLS